MTKILKPYTIIPSDLYVQRNADKQVRNIINDMGRPGYVLVSRQMGKTNLLLNAKRNLETNADAFVYIDLSNTFSNAKSCFENIIDIAIDTYYDKFKDVADTINERRQELKDIPPHKQHTNELRLLLNALNGGKLVIILDEIDALTKTEYSDQIFSQIRSTYFASRVNFKEFYNLTYLLSGVVEPNEIIKDPKVSPFNIGQKIYLNDFSKVEFEQFLTIAKIELNQKIIDRIYYWTSGNPRISWDVCSEVENILKKSSCTIGSIDKIVQEMYLTTFDKAPIDNIREIVKNDREIRNSIIEIGYNKGKQIPDKIKSKLYLAGIINYDEDEIHIKNEIISKSLNYAWLRSLEEEDKGLINIAMEEYKNLKYSESLSTFEKYLQDYEFSDALARPHYYYIMGHCAYILNNFDKATVYFDQANFDLEDDASWYFKVLYYKGLINYHLGKTEECLEYLKKIIDNGKKDSLYALTLLNYGSISIISDKLNHKGNSIKIFNEIINEEAFKKDKVKDDLINELKSIAHYNLAQIAISDKDMETAAANLKAAIDIGIDIYKPRFILTLIQINGNSTENCTLLNKLIDLIAHGKITPKEVDRERLIDFSFDDFRQIAIKTFIDYQDTFFTKIEPRLTILGNNSIYRHLYDLSIFSINKEGNWSNAIKLLQYIYDEFKIRGKDIDEVIKFNTVKLLAYSSDLKEVQGIKLEYLTMFQDKRITTINFIDLGIFVNAVMALIKVKNFDDALKYISLITSVKESVPEDSRIDYLFLYQLELNLYLAKSDIVKAISKAEEIIEFTANNKLREHKSVFLQGDNFDNIRRNAETVLRELSNTRTLPNTRAMPYVNTAPNTMSTLNVNFKKNKTYGRNEFIKVKYKSGKIVTDKFKKLVEDLSAGECIILN